MLLNLNSIDFKQLNPYIHVYYIPQLHDYLKTFKEEFKKIFQNSPAGKRTNEDPLEDIPMISNEGIYNVFNSILNKFYLIDSDWTTNQSIGIYYQDNNSNINLYHNHFPSSITATTYIDPPLKNEGGEIQFFIHEINQPIVLPQKDHVYFFPSWLMHRPLPQITPKERICMNWIYTSSKRPIHKLTGDRW